MRIMRVVYNLFKRISVHHNINIISRIILYTATLAIRKYIANPIFAFPRFMAMDGMVQIIGKQTSYYIRYCGSTHL